MIASTEREKHDDPTQQENQGLATGSPGRRPKMVSFRMARVRGDGIKVLQPVTSGSVQATAQHEKSIADGDDDDQMSPRSCASDREAVAHLSSEQPRRLTGISSTLKSSKGRLSSTQVSEGLGESATASRCSSTMQLKRTLAESSSEAALIGTVFMGQTESPISSLSSFGSCGGSKSQCEKRGTPEEQFEHWLHQSQKVRSSKILAKGGKDRPAIVSESLIEIAKARQEREAIEESESDSTSSLSNSAGEGGERGAKATEKITELPTLAPPRATARLARTSTLSAPRVDFAASIRAKFRTQELSRGIISSASTPRLTMRTSDGEGSGVQPQADVTHGDGRQKSMRHRPEGASTGGISESAASTHGWSADVVEPTAGNAKTTRTTSLEKRAPGHEDGTNKNIWGLTGQSSSTLHSDIPEKKPIVPASIPGLMDPSKGKEAKHHPVAVTCASTSGHDEGSGFTAGSPPMRYAERVLTAPTAMTTEQGAGNIGTSNWAPSPSTISSSTPFDSLVSRGDADGTAPSMQASAPKEEEQKATPPSSFSGDEGAIEAKAEPMEGRSATRLTKDGDRMPARAPERRMAIAGLDAEKMRYTALCDIRLKRSGGATKALEKMLRISSESIPEGKDEDSHASERRKDEVPEQGPGTERYQLSSQLHPAGTTQQQVFATDSTAEDRGDQGGPEIAQKPPTLVPADSNNLNYQEEYPADNGGYDGTAQIWSLQAGRAAESEESPSQARPPGLHALPVAVFRQRQKNPVVAKEPKNSFYKDPCSMQAPERQMLTAPVPDNVLASPATLPQPARETEYCAGGDETNSRVDMDEIRPNAVRDGICENDKCESVSSFFRPDAPTTTKANTPTDAWPTGDQDEGSSTLANRGGSGRLGAILPTETKARNDGGVHGHVDEGRIQTTKELAASDLWRAVPLVARRSSVTRDRWCSRILAEAAATIANGRGIRESAAFLPDQVECDCGCVGACDGVRTRNESKSPRSRTKEPMITGVGFCHHPLCAKLRSEPSQLIADAGCLEKSAHMLCAYPTGDAHAYDVHDDCLGKSRLEQASSASRTSPPIFTVEPRNVRDSWSTRILAEAAATLASHGVETWPVDSTIETVPGIPTFNEGGGSYLAQTRKEVLDGGRESTLGGCIQCLRSPTAESLASSHDSSLGGHLQPTSLPIARSRVTSPFATVPDRWTFSGSVASSETPLIVDFGSCLDSPTKDRPLSRESTTGVYDTGNGRHVPEFGADAESGISPNGSPQSNQQKFETKDKEGHRVGPSRPPATRYSHDSVDGCASRANVGSKTSAVRGGASQGKNVFIRVRNQTREFCDTFWARDGRMDDGRVSPDSGSTVGSRERAALPIVLNKDSKVSIARAFRRWSFSGLNHSPSQLPIIVDSGSIGLDL